MRVFWLDVHVNYACRHSGACCTSGWPIPVERLRAGAIEEAVTRKTVPLRVRPWLVSDAGAPDDVAGILSLRDNGHCVFFAAGGPGCAIHESRPAACVHFPYVCLIDPRGVHVTLSHYCPTAASMLFDHRGPIAIVEGASPVGEGETLEGLDARESLPPLREGTSSPKPQAPSPLLMSFEEFSDWERDQVAADEIGVVQQDDVALFDAARAAVPAPWSWLGAPPHVEAVWWELVAPAWPRFDDVLRRYAAAKVFASWAPYLGDGLDAARQHLRMAGAVLRVESARQCLQAGRALDRELLTQAIRQSDLLLVHHADPRALAQASV